MTTTAEASFTNSVIDGRYQIGEQLGTGATGAVFRGTQIAVDRQVAIKIMHEELQGEEDFNQRFAVEARAVASLQHPTIITLHDFGFWEERGVHYMVTELVEGEPLENWMRGRGDIAVQDIMQIAAQIADGLAHAHDNNIVHRDMKPGNVMVRRTGYGNVRAKILDFGLAQLRRDDKTNWDLTQPGMIYGTPLYMCPEQILGQRDLTPAADVYAFGIMLYELFEGRPPFYASSISEMLDQHLQQPPPPMVRARAPFEIEEMIYKCLAKDPADRIQSAEELLEIIYQFSADQPDSSMEVPRTLFEATETDGLSEPSVEDEIYELTELPSLFDLGDSNADAERDQAFSVNLWATGHRNSDQGQNKAAVIGALRIQADRPHTPTISDELPSLITEKTSGMRYLDVSKTFVGKKTGQQRAKRTLISAPPKPVTGDAAPMGIVRPVGILKPASHVQQDKRQRQHVPDPPSGEFLPDANDSFHDLEEISVGMIQTMNPTPDPSIESMTVIDVVQSEGPTAKEKDRKIAILTFVVLLLVLALGFAIVDPMNLLR